MRCCWFTRSCFGLLFIFPAAAQDSATLPSRIGFGSCADQNQPQPVLQQIVARAPEVFVYLGDNVYGDTRDKKVLKARYDVLGKHPAFRALKAKTQVLATWDDHDYGINDAGKEYVLREYSKQVFHEFWEVPDDRPSQSRPGIYDCYRYEANGRVLQIILLDTRSFRNPLKRNRPKKAPWKNDYQPDDSAEKTLLGTEQWSWLEKQLSEPADLRIIASSIQFGHEYNGWESWTNLPREQEKMLALIRKTRANGVVFISGDVHWAEISKRELEGGYPIYDITSSGINRTWPTIEPNKFRVGPPFRESNAGLFTIDWTLEDPTVSAQVIDAAGMGHLTHILPLSELQFPAEK